MVKPHHPFYCVKSISFSDLTQSSHLSIFSTFTFLFSLYFLTCLKKSIKQKGFSANSYVPSSKKTFPSLSKTNDNSHSTWHTLTHTLWKDEHCERRDVQLQEFAEGPVALRHTSTGLTHNKNSNKKLYYQKCIINRTKTLKWGLCGLLSGWWKLALNDTAVESLAWIHSNDDLMPHIIDASSANNYTYRIYS